MDYSALVCCLFAPYLHIVQVIIDLLQYVMTYMANGVLWLGLYFTVRRQGNSSVVLPESDLASQASWNLPQKCVRSF